MKGLQMRIEQKAKELVTSAVHEALAKTYGPKILDRIKGDSSYEMMKDRIHEPPAKTSLIVFFLPINWMLFNSVS